MIAISHWLLSFALLLTTNTYLGPKSPVEGNPQLVKVQVVVRDSLENGGPQVLSVQFNQQSIPLKPRDIYGNRGMGSFQVPPGKYKLQWKVNKNKLVWPRNIDREEQVTVSPRDQWVQILIEGEKVSIS